MNLNEQTINLEEYKYLSGIDTPADIKKLSVDELKVLCEEIRDHIIKVVYKTGGHLAPSLGAVEMTVAMHYVFDTPKDKLVWDVGHQAYSHKVLTGRKNSINTIRQYKGISGFCKISESEYDAFGAGHASTSISAAVGLAAARNLKNEKNHVIAIIGDGSFTGGLAYEGLNNISSIGGQFLVILNDNEMSISPNVGAMSNYFTRIVRSPKYIYYKNRIWNSLRYLPAGVRTFRKLGHFMLKPLKKILSPNILFEEFGLRYYGPVDGHNLSELIMIFKNIRNQKYPVILHVKTVKGKGLKKAEKNPTQYHGISPEKSVNIDEIEKDNNHNHPFLEAFGKIACELAEKYPEVIAITAAMKDGTGLIEYAEKFKKRYFDVGIAEGHAVTFAGGLAAEGFRPIVAIYSTFLQRAYDHIIHDITLQNLPVIFALDRAGLVGADGPTHHGNFDISYLNTIPNIIVAAPRNGNEMRDLFYTAIEQKKKAFAIRYPKDSWVEFDSDREGKILEIGSWETIEEGKKIAIISIGTMTNNVIESLPVLQNNGINPSVFHARFIKPFNEDILREIAKNHKYIITIEENSLEGGFGTKIMQFVQNNNLKTHVYSHGIPDKFIEHGSRNVLLRDIGLDAQGIADFVIKSVR